MIEIDLKLLTYDELMERARNNSLSSPPLWLQLKPESGEEDDWGEWITAWTRFDDSIIQRFGDECDVDLKKEEYGKTWRVWTWYPGDAADQYPWEEEET